MKTKALILVLMIACAVPAANAACTTIKEGILTYASNSYLYTHGQPLLKPGFDAYGTNYQAHLFNGSYFNNYANSAGFPPYDGDDAAYLASNPSAANHWAWPYRSVTVNMKWNEAWLSNQDCDGDGKRDRHYGFATYVGSGAWLTNHQSAMEGGVHWTYFVKIVAAPSSATSGGGVWSTADGTEIGPVIWNEFAIIQEVVNDPAAGDHGLLYKSPANPGWGLYKPE